jgi:hypothetical protein
VLIDVPDRVTVAVTDRGCVVSGTVVYNKNLVGGMRLSEDAVERLPKEGARVVSGNNDAYLRTRLLLCHRTVFSSMPI